jgi:hypothetical protein
LPLDNLFIHDGAEPVGADDEAYPVVNAAIWMTRDVSLYPESGRGGQMNAAEDAGVPVNDIRC